MKACNWQKRGEYPLITVDVHVCVSQSGILWERYSLMSRRSTHFRRSVNVSGRRRLAARRATSSLAAFAGDVVEDQLSFEVCDVEAERA